MPESGKKKNRMIGMLCAVFAVLLAAGLCMGNYSDSFGKAAVICWECIGLGK